MLFSTGIVSDSSVDRNLCCVGDDFRVTSEKLKEGNSGIAVN